MADYRAQSETNFEFDISENSFDHVLWGSWITQVFTGGSSHAVLSFPEVQENAYP